MSKDRRMIVIDGNPYIYELAIIIAGLVSYRNNTFKLLLEEKNNDIVRRFTRNRNYDVNQILIDICYAYIDRELTIEEDIMLSNITDTIISASSKHITEENILEPLKILFDNGLHQELYILCLELASDDEYLQNTIKKLEELTLLAMDCMINSMFQLELNGTIDRATLKQITNGSIIPSGIGLFYEDKQNFRILEER